MALTEVMNGVVGERRGRRTGGWVDGEGLLAAMVFVKEDVEMEIVAGDVGNCRRGGGIAGVCVVMLLQRRR